MPDSEPLGCFGSFLSLFGIRPDSSSQVSEELQYRQRDDFLSAAEFSFYRVLTGAISSSYVICPKVSLADVFFVKNGEKSLSYRNKIDRKHVDFLLCDPVSMKPVLGVELDDKSHARRDRQDRDEFVDQVFGAANLPIPHVTAATGYNPQNLAELVRQTIAGVAKVAVPKTTFASLDDTPTCTKCGTQMVLRTAKRSDQQGSTFWGCGNYPKCRETTKIVDR